MSAQVSLCKAHLLDLPDEVLVHIMQYIHDGLDVVHVGQSCSRFEYLTRTEARIWKDTRVNTFSREFTLTSKYFDEKNPLFHKRHSHPAPTNRKEYLELHRYLYNSNKSVEQKLRTINKVQQNMGSIQSLLFICISFVLFSWFVMAFILLYNDAIYVNMLYIPVNILAFLYIILISFGMMEHVRKITFRESAMSLFKVATGVGPLWLLATIVFDKMIRQMQQPDFLDPQSTTLNYWSVLLALPCICVIIMMDKQSSMFVPHPATRWAVRVNAAFWPLYWDGFWFVRWVPIPEFLIYGPFSVGFFYMMAQNKNAKPLITTCAMSVITAPMFINVAKSFGCTYLLLIPPMACMLASLIQAIGDALHQAKKDKLIAQLQKMA